MTKGRRARAYRHRIDIQENSVSHTKGDRTDSWSNVTDGEDVPCKIRFESTRERVRAGRNEASQSIIIEMRNFFDISPQNRIVWDGATWQVDGYPEHPDHRHRFAKFAAVKTDSGASP